MVQKNNIASQSTELSILVFEITFMTGEVNIHVFRTCID